MWARPSATRTLSYLAATPLRGLGRSCARGGGEAPTPGRAGGLDTQIGAAPPRATRNSVCDSSIAVRRVQHLDHFLPRREEVAGVRPADQPEPLDLGGMDRREDLADPAAERTGRRRSPDRSRPAGRTGGGRRAYSSAEYSPSGRPLSPWPRWSSAYTWNARAERAPSTPTSVRSRRTGAAAPDSAWARATRSSGASGRSSGVTVLSRKSPRGCAHGPFPPDPDSTLRGLRRTPGLQPERDEQNG